MLTILYIIIGFGIIIFFHEFGHFICAKKTGVGVEKFSIGFGPQIFGFKRGQTNYSLSLIPLGGYVKMAGEERKSSTGNKDEFYSQPWGKKMLILISGALMNFILGILLFFIFSFFYGVAVPENSTEIGQVIENTPAAKVGLVPGDKILEINTKDVNSWEEMTQEIITHPGEEIKLKILRDSEEIIIKVIPEYDEQKQGGFLGITPVYVTKKLNFIDSLKNAFWTTGNIIVLTLKSIWWIITGRVRAELMGPVGIGMMMAQTVKYGFSQFITLLGLISVSIGLFNLFPIPVLDGGNALFFTIEAIRKKPLSEKTIQITQTLGIVFLIILVIFATQQDILRLIKK